MLRFPTRRVDGGDDAHELELTPPTRSPNGVAVDVYYKTQTGMIPRERDGKMCRHGDKGMCDYCMPLEVSPTSAHPPRRARAHHHPPPLLSPACSLILPLTPHPTRLIRTTTHSALRLDLPHREQDQAPLVPVLPAQAHRLRLGIKDIDLLLRHPAPHTALVPGRLPVSVRLTCALASRDLLQVPTVGDHAPVAGVPTHGPRRVLLAQPDRLVPPRVEEDRKPEVWLSDRTVRGVRGCPDGGQGGRRGGP